MRVSALIVFAAVLVAACSAANLHDDSSTCLLKSGNDTVQLGNIPTGVLPVPFGNINDTTPIFFSVCSPVVLSSPCNTSGYVVVGSTKDQCGQVFDGVVSSAFDGMGVTRVYNSTASSTARLTLTIRCSSASAAPQLAVNASYLSSETGDAYDITVTSGAVCPGYAPQTTSPGPSRLQTAAIVGIVIGVVAFVVLASVIYQWRAKSIEENNYSSM